MLGGYAILYPRARVVTLVFIVIFITLIELPALGGAQPLALDTPTARLVRMWLIRAFEVFGWATHVRWPRPERLARTLKPTGS